MGIVRDSKGIVRDGFRKKLRELGLERNGERWVWIRRNGYRNK